jgi:hypothetical protein
MFTFDPVIPYLEIYPEEMSLLQYDCTEQNLGKNVFQEGKGLVNFNIFI